MKMCPKWTHHYDLIIIARRQVKLKIENEKETSLTAGML